MESSSVNGVCRCCASQGAFKDIKTSYHWMGEEEVYSDMLRECFDVNLTSVEQGGICELCITQLRNASNFKKQVLQTEAQFKQHLRSKGFKPVKEESVFDDNDSDDMDNGDDEDYVPDYEVPIKTESESEEKPKKRAAKGTSTRAKKSKSADGDATVKSFLSNVAKAEIKKEVETNWGLTIKKVKSDAAQSVLPIEYDITEPKTETRLNLRLKNRQGSSKDKSKSERKKSCTPKTKLKLLNFEIADTKQIKSDVKKIKSITDGKLKSKAPAVPLSVALNSAPNSYELELKRSIELDKHRYNIRTILHFSNATPIRTHYVGNGYACCFCKQFFLKAADLKSHTIKDHDRKQKNKFMANVFLSAFAVKLDITGLRCNICKDEMITLENLMEHLNQKHRKGLNMDIKSQTICFKLDNEELKCMFCQIECSSFKVLLEHMNSHYRNFVCEECDAGFVTQRMLWIHVDGHKQGEFKCEVCEKVFDKLRSLKYHTRMSHTVANRHKCYQCGEKFATIKSKKDHMMTIHGAQFPMIPCLACDRTFRDQNALRVHTKRDHLMERRFKCPDCDKSFYTKGLLGNHVVIHTGVREFKCELCGRDFARKKTLQTHMRTHRDDAKFPCNVCPKVLHSKASLESHVAGHAPLTAQESYSCRGCALTFYELPTWHHHMMTIHGEMPLG